MPSTHDSIANRKTVVKEVRCTCNRKLMNHIDVKGSGILEIKCPKCGKMNVVPIVALATLK